MGLSICVAQALLAHPLNYDMVWSATVKEVTHSTIFTEFPVILRKFRTTFALCSSVLVMIVVLAYIPYIEYQIVDWVAICPIGLVCAGHMLYPFLLKCVLLHDL